MTPSNDNFGSNWRNPYTSERTPLFARNVVATSQPLAAQAGLRMLACGGNAVDAAIAAAAVIAQTEPCSNGLGSDNFAIVWDGTQLHGMNASGISPSAWSHDYFVRRYGDDLRKSRPRRGWDTVTVPGAIAGWSALHQRFGSLPWADVLAPAIDYAQQGFAVSPWVAEKWHLALPLVQDQPGFAQHFMPRGLAPKAGDHFVLPGAARTLKRLAQYGAEDFYCGEIGAAIAAFSAATGGALTQHDLSAFWTMMQSDAWVGTISSELPVGEARYALHELPPNGQGITALMALGILQHTPFADCAVDSSDWHHWQIEAIKLAFADVYQEVTDPRHMRVRTQDLLDPNYLRQRARLIDPQQAQAFSAAVAPRGGTIYLTAADARGSMVSLIQSNYMGFGSGVVVPEYGISLQNRGHCFSFDPAHPNCVGPSKRPFHTIIPAFLMRDGLAQMSFGVMGGNMQPQGHVQTLTRMLYAGQQPQAACDAPRWKWNKGLQIEVEPQLPTSVRADLAQRGHHLMPTNDSYMDFGAGQFIWRLGDPAHDGYVAASDARRDGQAVGF